MQMQTVQVGGIELAVADQGSGPAVVLCHGFPSLARSWRHQVAGLVAAGYRVIAPDMRGYGGSSAPADPAHYDRETTVTDMTGLLDVLGIDRAVFVGHDFGASLAWDLPLWAPERVAGVAVLSVPLLPRTPVPPTVAYAHMAREHFLHMHYFQTPGVADAELDADPAGFLTRIYWSLSDADRWLTCFQHPSEGNGYLDVLPDAPDLPWEWMTAEEFDPYIQTFTRTGFTGGLNWYRAMDAVWEQNGRLTDHTVRVPAAFIAGAREPVVQMMGAGSLEKMRELVPDLRMLRLIDDAGHFVQLQRPDEVTAALREFLADIGWASVG